MIKVKTVDGSVKQMREIRDKLNLELKDMTSEERMEYFRKLRIKRSAA